ncbi:reverse transcriptase-like protein, partial [Acinetobacter baumannii]
NQKQYPEPDADTWLAWFDGSALPNPGKCCIACILQAPDGRTFEYIAGFGYGDSCDAEYSGLILTLHHANQHQVKRLQVHGDSQVVIN